MTMLPSDPPRGWRLVTQHEKLKAIPFYFIMLFYASMIAIVWTGGGTGLAGGTVVVIVFAMWIYSIMTFSRAAERQRGWRIAVLEYHVASLGFLLCYFVVLPSCVAAAGGEFGPVLSLRFVGAILGLMVSVLIYGDARRRVAHLRIVRDS